MSESFEKRRREPLLEELYYEQSVRFKEQDLVDPEITAMLEDQSIDNARRKRNSWRRTFKTLELLIQRYSGGDPVSSLVPCATRAFTQFQRHYAAFPDAKLKLWEPDAYQYVMWLLSLAVLLGPKEWVPTIATWISTDPEDGQDVLVSRLFGQFGVSLPGDSLIREKPYGDLLRATETQGEAQQKTMADYLKRWYGGMKNCYWYDRHKRLEAGFFGYWAFEAGLVTLLWSIDDSGYRDKRFYPKDLVDFAREQAKAPQGEVPKPHISRKTGERCPYTGRWGVLESPGAFVQERMFKEGDVFPEGIGRDRQEGPVTWIVMSREDGGPTREA
ncbi:PoNi-like cognate immunity protein [Paraburkholderia sp. J41]|uniref:PoNi-like cognate immunity protein n=1 Tax=Paraburkholderia sp. J41 TaxID=2805433 RepID=UPI002AC33CB1|nr:PoNe immunity protein domain-containing protein [Paraburkholderia sp. J41]